MRRRPALAAGAAELVADDAEELRQELALLPEDVEFLDHVRGDGHRLALALSLVWAPERGSGMRAVGALRRSGSTSPPG